MSDVQTETLYSVPKAHCFIGGPSCGKTSALVARAKELASSGQPGGILYVCASKAAVDGVRQQIFDFDIEVKTGLELAREVLVDEELVARGVRNRLLGQAEERALMEDVKVCGIKRRRLRELAAFLECGWSKLDDNDPSWVKTNEEELVSGLIRGNLEFTGGVLACEASALAVRQVAADEGLRARHARAHILVDDFECLGRATQMLTCMLAGASLCVAASDVAPVALDEPYPYAQGVQELLSSNSSARVEHLNVCRKPAGIVKALNALRADESMAAEPLTAAAEIDASYRKGKEGTRFDCSEAIGGFAECSALNSAEPSDECGGENGDAREGVFEKPVETSFSVGIIEEFADIAAHVKSALSQGVSPSAIYVAGTDSTWRANLLRYFEQAGIPAVAAKRKGASAGGPSLRVLLGDGDPLCRSVEIARLRAIAQPQGLHLQPALEALAAGTLQGASVDDSLLSGLVDAYWAARGKMAAAEERDGAKERKADTLDETEARVRVGAPLDACSQLFDLVIFGGFVNGFIPSADYCDPAGLAGAARERAHAADAQAVYRCLCAAQNGIAFTGFTECSLEAAEQLKLHIARIKLKRGVRMCSIEPSELLGVLGIEA